MKTQLTSLKPMTGEQSILIHALKHLNPKITLPTALNCYNDGLTIKYTHTYIIPEESQNKHWLFLPLIQVGHSINIYAH